MKEEDLRSYHKRETPTEIFLQNHDDSCGTYATNYLAIDYYCGCCEIVDADV